MIIEILANHGQVGGGEVMLLHIAEALQPLGHDIRIVGPSASDLAHEAQRRDLDHIGLEATSRRALLTAYERFGRSSRADLLWCNGPIPSLATTTSSRARFTHLHQVPSRIQSALLRPSRRRSLRTLVPSEFMAAAIPGSTAFTNWTEWPSPDRRIDRAGRSRGAPLRIGFIGRTSTLKGLHILAMAVDRLRTELDLTLVVAGDGRFVPAEELEPVERALDPLGTRVERIGWVERESFFDQVDVVVVPSIWGEPFGLVAAEAMSRSIPLVVTAAGALTEIVGPDHPWVVPVGDPVALGEAILAVADRPSEVIASTTRGEQRWRDRYSPDAGAARTTDLLARQLG